MRKLLLTTLGFCFIWHASIASAIPSGSIRYHDLPSLRVVEFLNLPNKDIEKITGHKMNLGARISFRLLKAKMKKAAKKDPAITVKEFMSSQKKMKTWLLVLIIVLGAILIAFLIFALAYSGAI